MAPAAPARELSARGTATFVGVAACFILSGFAALLYQTAWMRQFSILFGTSELAIASVLAAYMGGLALGSAIGGRIAPRVKRPVLAYGILEAGIAGGALLVPVLLSWSTKLLQTVLGGQPAPPQADALSHSLFYVAVTFGVILIPTTLMGATLPLLTRYAVAREEDIGQRVGLLYALNTAGAVAGTLVAAFLLLPAYGLAGTVLWGVGVNVVVFGIAALVAMSKSATPRDFTAPDELTPGAEAAASATGWERLAHWVLPMMLVSGALSFMYEVLWTRLVSHLMGGSVRGFATMLASFLIGITLGSAVASRFARDRRGSLLGFAVCQVGTALLSTLIYILLDQFAALALDMTDEGGLTTAGQALLCMGVLLPATLCIGATFPFALRVLARSESEAGLATGRVYAWNTSGAILGSLGAGFFLVPGLGYAGTTTLGAVTNLALALTSLWILGNRRALVGTATLGLVCFVPLLAGAPDKLLFASPLPPVPGSEGGRKLFQAVGRSSSVLMLEQRGRLFLRTNGLPEAWIEPAGSPLIAASAGHWLSMIPVCARPQAKSLLMVGFGGGVALEAVPPSVETVDCIELEPEVIAANRSISDRRMVDPLADERINIIYNDARGALNLTSKRYDIVVSQPSHPWTAGASHLFTSEFAGLVKEHLTDDGVFLQWMNTEFIDAELLKSMGATLLANYAHVRLYCVYPEVLMFLASEAPLNVEEDIARTGEPIRSHPDWYELKRIVGVEDIISHLALEEEGLRSMCEGAPIITDDANLMAMHSQAQMEGWLEREVYDELMRPYDPLLDRSSRLGRELGDEINWLAIAQYHLGVGAEVRAQRIAFRDPDEARRYVALGLITQSKGDTQTAIQHLQHALEIDPRNQDARYTLASIYYTVPEHQALVEPTLEGLQDPYLATFRAHGAAQGNRFDEVRGLDPRLAIATPQQVVYPITLQLRALWRCFDQEQPRERALEAIDLISRIRILTDTEYRIRMHAAKVAQLPRAWIETADDLVEFMLRTEVPPAARAAAAGALADVQQALAGSPEGSREAEIRDAIATWLSAN